jgi:pyruvate, water dikinase
MLLCARCADRVARILLTGTGVGVQCAEGFVAVRAESSGTAPVFVVAMTSPEDIGALLESVAVVTDQGDLMCHAAVIARELDIACVVGTKDATAVLIVGQPVSVCSREGIVFEALKGAPS